MSPLQKLCQKRWESQSLGEICYIEPVEVRARNAGMRAPKKAVYL